MDTLKAIIVDDEKLARRGLEIRLETVADVDVVAQCANGRQALEAVRTHKPDILLLDVQMPGMDGFEVVKALGEDLPPVVIFVTAFDQFAINAFESSAVDYLLKPIDDSRLHQALFKARQALEQRKAVEQRRQLMGLLGDLTGKPCDEEAIPEDVDELLAQTQRTTLSIKDRGKTVRVDYADITHIEAAGDYMCVYADGQTHILRATMKELEGMLNPTVFQRVHRSTMVNVNAVTEIHPHINGEHFLALNSGQTVKLSRTYKSKIRHFR